MEAKKRVFDRHREAQQQRTSYWARTSAPRLWFKERSASLRPKALRYSTQITVKPVDWAASRCFASLVMKGIASPEAV